MLTIRLLPEKQPYFFDTVCLLRDLHLYSRYLFRLLLPGLSDQQPNDLKRPAGQLSKLSLFLSVLNTLLIIWKNQL